MTVNQSLYTGIFPSCLKQSHITPIIKDSKGDPESLLNYRPVIDLSFLSKILEKTVLRQLIPHLETNSLLHPHQSAYKKNHSCETALLKIYEDLLKMSKPKSFVFILFLDFTAAFDTVNHSILFNKLQHQFLIKETALNWFKSFLCINIF